MHVCVCARNSVLCGVERLIWFNFIEPILIIILNNQHQLKYSTTDVWLIEIVCKVKAETEQLDLRRTHSRFHNSSECLCVEYP
jgi:hypothetical protein